MAGTRSFLFDLEQQCVSVTVIERFFDELAITAGVALAPQFLAAARPIDPMRPSVRVIFKRLFVHPRQHQDVAVFGVLGNGRDQAIACLYLSSANCLSVAAILIPSGMSAAYGHGWPLKPVKFQRSDDL